MACGGGHANSGTAALRDGKVQKAMRRRGKANAERGSALRNKDGGEEKKKGLCQSRGREG